MDNLMTHGMVIHGHYRYLILNLVVLSVSSLLVCVEPPVAYATRHALRSRGRLLRAQSSLGEKAGERGRLVLTVHRGQ